MKISEIYQQSTGRSSLFIKTKTDRLLYVYMDSSLWCQYSDTKGKSWSSPSRIANLSSYDRFLDFTIGSEGSIFVVASKYNARENGRAVQVFKSSDNGLTWHSIWSISNSISTSADSEYNDYKYSFGAIGASQNKLYLTYTYHRFKDSYNGSSWDTIIDNKYGYLTFMDYNGNVEKTNTNAFATAFRMAKPILTNQNTIKIFNANGMGYHSYQSQADSSQLTSLGYKSLPDPAITIPDIYSNLYYSDSWANNFILQGTKLLFFGTYRRSVAPTNYGLAVTFSEDFGETWSNWIKVTDASGSHQYIRGVGTKNDWTSQISFVNTLDNQLYQLDIIGDAPGRKKFYYQPNFIKTPFQLQKK